MYDHTALYRNIIIDTLVCVYTFIVFIININILYNTYSTFHVYILLINLQKEIIL
jgi:hypothetical protein